MQAPQPDVQTIRLHKSNNGMGLSIVAAKVSTIVCIVYNIMMHSCILIVFLLDRFFPRVPVKND